MPTKPTLSIFESTEEFDLVFREQNQINVKFVEFNLPLTSTTGRIASNVLGKNRFIMLQGVTSGTGFGGADAETKLKNFIIRMEGWVNPSGWPSISPSITYTNSFGVEYTVDVVDWTWIRSMDDPFRIVYTLLMKQA